MCNCKQHPVCSLAYRKGGRVSLSGFYRTFLGRREQQNVWIVDGQKVAVELYPEFIMGGNDQRYRFNPPGDIWLDNRIGVEEMKPTLEHELIERRLMRERGWSYDRAHTEGGLQIEKQLRALDERRVARRRKQVPAEVGAVYRSLYGTREGVKLWIVDGPMVRKQLFPDFCFGTHDLRKDFVPAGEIWLDSAMSIEEAHYSSFQLVLERRLLTDGQTFDHAYDCAHIAGLQERMRQSQLAQRHEASLAPVSYGVRARGVRSA